MKPAASELATNEEEVIAKIVAWAAAQAPVRLVLLTSSRANPVAARDLLSDYDIDLVVTDPRLYAGSEWLRGYGEPLLQVRDSAEEFGLWHDNCMVLYADGTKIDYRLWTQALIERIGAAQSLPPSLDSGYRVLLDKDGATYGWPDPTHTAYIPAKPTEADYRALIEEFWFVATYVAKYLWRDEFIPVKVIFDYELKYLLLRRLLEWRVEIDRGWSVQPGFFGRGLQRYMDPALWAQFEATYTGPDRGENWQAFFATLDLFRRLAKSVARDLGYVYPEELDTRMTRYLEQIKALSM